jgi:predicted alpha/beta-fold hydrolase
MYGMYDKAMGVSVKTIMLKHEPVFREHFKEKFGFDLKEKLESEKPSLLRFDDEITAPFFGYLDRADYYDRASCYHRIPSIKIPTFFMNALDDPIVTHKSIDYDVIKSNPNTVVGITKHGGHIGYNTTAFNNNVWFMNPALDFLNAYIEKSE